MGEGKGTMRYRAMICGGDSAMLDEHLRLVGVPREKVWITESEDRSLLAREIHECRPKAILALGSKATEILTGWKGAMAEVVGRLHFCELAYHCWVIPNWHPSYLTHNPMKGAEFSEALGAWAFLVRLPGRQR